MLESKLLAQKCGFVAGRWAEAGTNDRLEVRNPATGEVLATLPMMSEAETLTAIESASAAIHEDNSPESRRAWLLAVDEHLRSNREELGRIITFEHGKPLRESVAEVDYAAGFFRFFAGQVERLQPKQLTETIRGCRWTIHHRPAGVVGLITPWNFPLAMLAKKVAPAIAAGCGVVAKPASLTPLSAIALWHLFERVELPPRRLNLVVGRSNPIGRALCTHRDVRVISFTGSTEVGQELLHLAAPHVKRMALELGGNTPFTVFPDANLEAAAGALVANKFRAGGQTCVCTNRVYVHADIHARFTELLAERVRALRVGDGMNPNTDIGPLIDREGFEKVAAHVSDALTRGARLLVGADPPRPPENWGAFYPPTLLVDVAPEMLVCREETFGPVVAVSTFTDEQGVIREANSTPYGLAAYVFTSDASRADRVIRQLHFGHIGLNTGTGPTPEAPFGGMKESGFGREGGFEGLLEFCETQVVANG
jgi:succinate-semialdehyde dehydrogenase/glutarate-semialdehyde dehydrogenase